MIYVKRDEIPGSVSKRFWAVGSYGAFHEAWNPASAVPRHVFPTWLAIFCWHKELRLNYSSRREEKRERDLKRVTSRICFRDSSKKELCLGPPAPSSFLFLWFQLQPPSCHNEAKIHYRGIIHVPRISPLQFCELISHFWVAFELFTLQTPWVIEL